MMTKTFEPHLKVDGEVAMSYFYLREIAPGEVARTLEVAAGVLLDVDEADEPLGIEIFGESEVPVGKLTALRVAPAHAAQLVAELAAQPA